MKPLKAREGWRGRRGEGRGSDRGSQDCPLQPCHSRHLEVYMPLAPRSGAPGLWEWSVVVGDMPSVLKTLGLHSSFQETHPLLQSRVQVFGGSLWA